jgi:chromosome segregation ATPase
LQHARRESQIEKDQLQEMAAEHKAAFERVEHELKDLQEQYENLEGELQEKQEEIELYQAQVQTGDSSKLHEQIKELKEEIQQVEIEKGDLEDQIQSLQRDAAQLIEKDGKVTRERSDERKTLQNVITLMKVLIIGN